MILFIYNPKEYNSFISPYLRNITLSNSSIIKVNYNNQN